MSCNKSFTLSDEHKYLFTLKGRFKKRKKNFKSAELNFKQLILIGYDKNKGKKRPYLHNEPSE